jgi:tetratricopeptide (TPR) repeat protein
MLQAILRRTAWDAAGAVEAAERALACMLRLEIPENRVAEAWAELGFARFAGGDFGGAEEAFRHSGHTAFIPPMKVQADLLRAHCYHQLGDAARARRVLERTVNRIPPGSDLMRSGVEIIAAELERHEGRTDEALQRVLAAIAASERRYRPPQARVVGLLAELWIDAGRPDRARRALEQYDQPGRRDALEWASAEALVAAVSGDTETLDEVLSCIEADRSAQAVIAIARRLERTADRALGLDRGLAARAGALAVAAWERAQRVSDADRVRAALWATGLGSDRPVG